MKITIDADALRLRVLRAMLSNGGGVIRLADIVVATGAERLDVEAVLNVAQERGQAHECYVRNRHAGDGELHSIGWMLSLNGRLTAQTREE